MTDVILNIIEVYLLIAWLVALGYGKFIKDVINAYPDEPVKLSMEDVKLVLRWPYFIAGNIFAFRKDELDAMIKDSSENKPDNDSV